MLPYLVDRPVNLHRFPDGVAKPGFWHKAVPKHAPEWLQRWHNADADPGETQEYLVLDSPAALAWAANYGAIELHPWTSTTEHPHQPTWAMIDIDPGESSTFDDVVVLARLHRTALDHVGVRGNAEGDRQARHPDLGARRRWPDVRRHPRVGRTVVSLDRRVGARDGQLGVGGRQARRPGAARLHAERDQQDPRRSVQHPTCRRRRRCRSRSRGTSSTIPICGPIDGTSRTIAERLDTAGDPLAPLIGLQQRLPKHLDVERFRHQGRRAYARSRDHQRAARRISTRVAMSSPTDDPPGALHREYKGDLATLRSARRDVVEWLARQGADEETKDRAALIVSELTSNAIQAAPGSPYHLQVTRVDHDSASISVRNHPTRGLPPARQQWRAPSDLPLGELALRGRGLAIVDSLSEDVTVEHDGRTVVVTARLRIDAAAR